MIQAFFAKLAKRERILAFVAGGAIFLVFMDQVVLGPIMSQMKVYDASIEAKSQTLRRNLRILSFKDSIMKEYEKYQRYLSPADKNAQELIADRLHTVESLAAQKTVSIANIKAGDISENPISREIPITFDCEGTLENLLELMKLLEESNYVFRISKFKFTPKAKGSDLIKASIDVVSTVIENEKS